MSYISPARERLVSLLQQAFENDPLFSYAFTKEHVGITAIRRYFNYVIRYCEKNGKIIVSPDGQGILAWIPGYHFPPKPKVQLLKTTPETILRLELHENTPETIIAANGNNYGYIWLLAISPDSQGKGVGGQLVNEALRQMAEFELGECWLSTENPKNKIFYQKHGFQLFTEEVSQAELTTYIFTKNLNDTRKANNTK